MTRYWIQNFLFSLFVLHGINSSTADPDTVFLVYYSDQTLYKF